MKRWICFLMAACLLSACFPELVETPKPEYSLDPKLEGEPVMVEFSVPDIPVLMPTKEQGDIGEADYLHPDKFYIAVCGHSQSIKYIRKAEYVESYTENIGDRYPYPDYGGIRPPTTVNLHKFRVQLELSDSDRTIHFLGNIDENQLVTGSYSYQILPGLLSEEKKQAYWQSVKLYKILPKRVHTDPDDEDSPTVPVMQDGFYVLDPLIADTLCYVPLIRNFAHVQVVDSTENFELYSYAVISQPKRGSVVPYRYNSDTKYDRFEFGTYPDYVFSGYERCTISDLENLNYAGNLPVGIELDDFVPTAAMFENPSSSDGRVIRYQKGADQGFPVYERGAPTATMDPTFVILRGRLKNSAPDPDNQDTEGYSYFRLDLMETTTSNNQSVSHYYPLYRNFKYRIALHRISSTGVKTPEAAVNTFGLQDISADVSMRYLSDISNGITRLVVEPYMSKTFTGPKQNGFNELYVRFFNDIDKDEPNKATGAVMVQLEPVDDGGPDFITLYDEQQQPVTDAYYYPTATTVGGVEGIRIIRFNVTDPGETTRTQKIKITGRRAAGDTLRLYREVEISLQKKQPMSVSCTPTVVVPTKWSEVTLNVAIPAGLPASMFPLEFVIEPENMTLTPNNKVDGNNLPVITGESLIHKNKTTFQFVRTLTRDEYLRQTSGNWSTFYSYFKTNRDVSVTDIYVANDYFIQDSTHLANSHVPRNQFYVRAESNEGCIVQFKVTTGDLEYKVDEEGEWKTYTSNVPIHLNRTQKAFFRSTKMITNWKGDTRFYCSVGGSNAKNGTFSIGGNIASLIVGDQYEIQGEGLTGFYFENFFKGHTGLVDASDLVIPMKKMGNSCFKSFFEGCTSLEKAPALPATVMADKCYRDMFLNCTSLTEAPYLPAETIANNCYQRMFYGCTSLALIKMNSKEYRASAFLSDETTWVGTVGDAQSYVHAGGTIWLNPAIRNASGYTNVIPDGWTVKYFGEDSE